MAAEVSNARIFGSDLDSIWLAPFGTALPTTIDGEPVGFEDVGWLHADGITESATGSKEVIRGHQGGAIVRTRMGESGTTIAFTALESKPQTRALRYDEKTVDTAVAGVRKVTRGAGQKVSVRAAVIDVFDADNITIKERLCIPRLEVVSDGERVYVNNDIAGFPFIGEVIGDYISFETAVDETP